MNPRVLIPTPLLLALPSPALAAADPALGGSLLQVLLGLVAVLVMIGGGAWLLRRMGPLQAGASGALRILGGLSMGARERVVLIQVGKTQLLLGVAPGRVQTLHVLDQPLPLAAPGGNSPAGTPQAGFAERLAGLLQQGKRP